MWARPLKSLSTVIVAALAAMLAVAGYLRGDALAQARPVCAPNEVFDGGQQQCVCGEGLERAGGACVRREHPSRAADAANRLPPPANQGPVKAAEPAPRTCLAAEIKELVGRFSGRRRDVDTCELACLVRPPGLDPDDAGRLQWRHGIKWCRECVAVTSLMTPEAIAKLERESNATLCPRPIRPEREVTKAGGLIKAEQKGLRVLFGNRRPPSPHGHIAVVIGNARGNWSAPAKQAVKRNTEAMTLLLIERLGYRHGNVVELADAQRGDLDRLLGDGAKDKGLLSERLARAPGAELLIYVSGAIGFGGTEEGAHLVLPANVNGRGSETGYPLERLYQRLADLRAASVVVVLELAANRPQNSLVAALNLPETDWATLPVNVRRGVAVMTASERDQVPLEDYETGLSLFTRHLVEGMAGAADKAPEGNGDGVIDTTEAFAYAAGRTMLTARRVYGVLQRPMLSQARSAVLPGTSGSPPPIAR